MPLSNQELVSFWNGIEPDFGGAFRLVDEVTSSPGGDEGSPAKPGKVVTFELTFWPLYCEPPAELLTLWKEFTDKWKKHTEIHIDAALSVAQTEKYQGVWKAVLVLSWEFVEVKDAIINAMGGGNTGLEWYVKFETAVMEAEKEISPSDPVPGVKVKVIKYVEPQDRQPKIGPSTPTHMRRLRVGTDKQPSAFLLDLGQAPVGNVEVEIGPETRLFLQALNWLMFGLASTETPKFAEFDNVNPALTKSEARRVFVRRLAVAAFIDRAGLFPWRVKDLADLDFRILLVESVRPWFNSAVGQPQDLQDLPGGMPFVLTYGPFDASTLPAFLANVATTLDQSGPQNSSQSFFYSAFDVPNVNFSKLDIIADTDGATFKTPKDFPKIFHFGLVWDPNPTVAAIMATVAMQQYVEDEGLASTMDLTPDTATEAIMRFTMRVPFRRSTEIFQGVPPIPPPELGWAHQSATQRTPAPGVTVTGYPPYNSRTGPTPSLLDLWVNRFAWGPELSRFAQALLRAVNLPCRILYTKYVQHTEFLAVDRDLAAGQKPPVAISPIASSENKADDEPYMCKALCARNTAWTPARTGHQLTSTRAATLMFPLSDRCVIGQVLGGDNANAYARHELDLCIPPDLLPGAFPDSADYSALPVQTFLASAQGQEYKLRVLNIAARGLATTAWSRFPANQPALQQHYKPWAKAHVPLVQQWEIAQSWDPESSEYKKAKLALQRSRHRFFPSTAITVGFKELNPYNAAPQTFNAMDAMTPTAAGPGLLPWKVTEWQKPKQPGDEGKGPGLLGEQGRIAPTAPLAAAPNWLELDDAHLAAEIDEFAIALAKVP